MAVRLVKTVSRDEAGDLYYAFEWVPETAVDVPALVRLAGINLNHHKGPFRIHGPILYRAGPFN
jgi:hypothetical protein